MKLYLYIDANVRLLKAAFYERFFGDFSVDVYIQVLYLILIYTSILGIFGMREVINKSQPNPNTISIPFKIFNNLSPHQTKYFLFTFILENCLCVNNKTEYHCFQEPQRGTQKDKLWKDWRNCIKRDPPSKEIG